MRNFACRNFKNSTELYSKLSYRPCYVQVAMNLRRNSIKTTDKNKKIFRVEIHFVIFIYKGKKNRNEKIYSNYYT